MIEWTLNNCFPHNTLIHQWLLSGLGTGTSTKSGGVNIYPLSEMVQSCKSFTHGVKCQPSHMSERTA
jgi:hypothetical protein